MTRPSPSRITVALLIGMVAPAALLTAAITMQHVLGLVPCEMCLEQRAALWTAFGLATAGLLLRRYRIGRAMAPSSAVAVAASGGIAIHQLGGERHWWMLHAPCASTMRGGGSALDEIMRIPYVRCDVPQWKAIGLTMADLNAAACLTTFILMAWMIVRGTKSKGIAREPKLPRDKEDC